MMDIEHERKNQLEDIIVNKRITPVFQPIVSLQDGSVLGFEALSRMTQPGVSLSHLPEEIQKKYCMLILIWMP